MSSFADAVVQVKNINDWLWVVLSQLSLAPGSAIVALKLAAYWRGTELAPTSLNRWTDFAFRWLFMFCFVYYAIDSLSIVLLGRFFHICYQSYFMHHFASVMALLHVFSTKKPFFWFETLLAVMHSFVLSFPAVPAMQYLYIGSFVNLTVQVHRAPYKNIPDCWGIRKYIPVAFISFGMMKYFDCLHMLDAVNADRPAV